MSGLVRGRGKIVVLAAVVLLSTMSGAGAADAVRSEDEPLHIPSVCKIYSYAPKKIVLGVTPVKATFNVYVNNTCTLDAWAAYAYPFVDNAPASKAGRAGKNWSYWAVNAAGDNVKVVLKQTISLTPRSLVNSDAGQWRPGVKLMALGKEDPTEDIDFVVDPAVAYMPFTVRRRATFGSTFNASPEPVKKGGRITFKATLARVDWNGAKKLGYVGFPGYVALQFKPDGGSTWSTKKADIASAKGKISFSIRATRSGSWRLQSRNYVTTAEAVSWSDEVKVN